MTETHNEVSMSALTGFGRYWLIALLVAVASAIAANALVGVPLASVVDVVMALLLVGLSLIEVYFLVRALGYLIAGRVSDAMLWFGAMGVYLLLLFPPILAFNGYAWFTGQTLAGTTHMYDNITGAVAGVFKLPAQLISALLVLILNGGSAYVNYVAKAQTALEIAANLLSIIIALQTLVLSRRHRRHAED